MVDVPTKFISNKTIVTLCFLSEVMGYTVTWKETNMILSIE